MSRKEEAVAEVEVVPDRSGRLKRLWMMASARWEAEVAMVGDGGVVRRPMGAAKQVKGNASRASTVRRIIGRS